MRVKAGPFPAVRRVQVAIGVENVRTAEGLRFPEPVNGAHAGRENAQEQQEQEGNDNHEQAPQEPAQ